jgi:hypothetical protein
MRRIATVMLSLFLFVLLLCVGPGQALAAESSQGNQGLQDGWAIDDECRVLFSAGVAAKMREAGAGWVRINFRLGSSENWTETDTCSGSSALDLYDQVVQNALDNGLEVVGLLSNESWAGGQAAWQENNAEMDGGNGDNGYLDGFSKMAAVPLAQHFSGRVDTWEVWNEPNAYTTYSDAEGYTGASFIYPSNFAWLLRHVYEDVWDAEITGVQLLSGGVFGHDLGGLDALVEGRRVTKRGDPMRPGYAVGLERSAVRPTRGRPPKDPPAVLESGSEYLRATYEQGKANAGWDALKDTYGTYPLDGIGQHIYIDQERTTSARKIGSYLRDVRNGYTAYEGKKTTKQTYVTEVGWTTASVSQTTQAKNLETAYGQFEKTTYVRTACWFQLRDIAAAGLYYGLLTPFDPPWIEKPSWDAYRSAAVY